VPYTDISTAVVIDLMVLTGCTILLLIYGRLAHSHPAISYIFFHGIVVSSRLLAILAGAEPMFSILPELWSPIREDELARAAFMADATLLIMTVAWIRASVVDAKKNFKHHSGAQTQPVTLSLQHIWRVVAVVAPVGILGLLLLGNIPGIQRLDIDLGEWQESSWVLITMTWAGLALLALIYWYGLRWWLLAPMVIHLGIMAIQGYSRVRFIIPLILLLQIYLDRQGKKWPSTVVIAVIVSAVLLFFPMKTIGKMTLEGASVDDITQSSAEKVRLAMSGQHGDQEILDQFACSLTLIDQSQKLYYGLVYLALVTSPIPRQWWPDKPGLADYLKEISTPFRPMAELGMVMTFMGEFYINFGLLGIIIMSYLMAYWLARLYFHAYRNNYYSVMRFAYLLVACNLIQVYRDGLMSLVIFTFINMMPLVIIVLLHFFFPVSSKKPAYTITPYPQYPEIRS
jgi:hypothetical protein